MGQHGSLTAEEMCVPLLVDCLGRGTGQAGQAGLQLLRRLLRTAEHDLIPCGHRARLRRLLGGERVWLLAGPPRRPARTRRPTKSVRPLAGRRLAVLERAGLGAQALLEVEVRVASQAGTSSSGSGGRGVDFGWTQVQVEDAAPALTRWT